MRLIRPIEVTSSNLLSSDVPDVPPAAYNGGTTYDEGDRVSELQIDGFTYKVYESLQDGNTGQALADTDWWLYLADTYAEYNAGTTYDDGDIVISTTTNRAYESLQGANTGEDLTDPAWWLDLGPTNRFRMFDNSTSSQTSNGAQIAVQVQVSGRADSVALLNIVGAEVRVVMETVEDGVLFDETFNLVSDSGIDDWYEYFFEPIVRRGDYLVLGLPIYGDPKISVTLTEPDGSARIGALIIGFSRDLGYAVHPMRTGIQDYSRKDVDDFGNFTIIQRNFARTGNFKVAVEQGAIDAMSALLAEYRAEAVVWVGVDSFASSWIYGFYKDFTFDHASPNDAYLNIEIEGLT